MAWRGRCALCPVTPAFGTATAWPSHPRGTEVMRRAYARRHRPTKWLKLVTRHKSHTKVTFALYLQTVWHDFRVCLLWKTIWARLNASMMKKSSLIFFNFFSLPVTDTAWRARQICALPQWPVPRSLPPTVEYACARVEYGAQKLAGNHCWTSAFRI